MTPAKQRAAFIESMRDGLVDSNEAVKRAEKELDTILVMHGAKSRYDDYVSQLGMQPVDAPRIRAEFNKWLYGMPRVNFAFQRFQALDRLESDHAMLLDIAESEDT